MYIYVFKTKSLIIPKGRSEFRKSEKDIQHNGLKKKDKGTNSDLQNNAHKAKDRVKRTTLSTRGEHRCSGMASSSCATSATHLASLVTNLMISHDEERTQQCLRQEEISVVICDTDVP